MFVVYGSCDTNIVAAVRAYNEKYPNRRPITRKIMTGLIWNVRRTGQLRSDNSTRGRTRSNESVENEEAVIDFVEENPTISVRDIERRSGIPKSTAHRILQDEGLYPYHLRRVQALLPRDMPDRLAFCQWLLNEDEQNPDTLKRILWTDESTFTREGVFNTRNSHVWSYDNPHATTIRSFQAQWTLNVWAGIIGDHILGPFFLPARLTGEAYLNFLENDLPILLEDVALNVRRNMWYQQDGAGPHFANIVKDFLNNTYAGRWIGRAGSINWPPRSPDLTPLDFFLWGYVKQKVYSTEIDTVETLRQRIIAAFEAVKEQGVCENVRNSTIRRLQTCIETEGDLFEHLL